MNYDNFHVHISEFAKHIPNENRSHNRAVFKNLMEKMAIVVRDISLVDEGTLDSDSEDKAFRGLFDALCLTKY